MKIALYFEGCTPNSGGIYHYAIAVLRMLLNEPSVSRITIMISDEQRKEMKSFLSEPKIQCVTLQHKDSILYQMFYKCSGVLSDMAEVRPSGLGFLKKISPYFNPYKYLFESLDVDVIHIPFQVSKVYNIRIPIVLSMHDVQELLFPVFFSPLARINRAITRKRAVEQADHLMVSFAHIKKDLISFFEVEPRKISICPLPISDDWFFGGNPTPSHTLVTKHKLPESFILYPAQTWKHKNHLALIEALSILAQQGHIIPLVCTGGITTHYEEIKKTIDARGMSDSVRFLGLVPEEDLLGLYSLTRLVVLPTLYEAGSGPLFEAMEYGAPVICSNVTSLPECIGSDDYTFDATDPHDIAEKILKGFNDDDFRNKNKLNSKTRMLEYRQKNYTFQYLEAYKTAISGKKHKYEIKP